MVSTINPYETASFAWLKALGVVSPSAMETYLAFKSNSSHISFALGLPGQDLFPTQLLQTLEEI